MDMNTDILKYKSEAALLHPGTVCGGYNCPVSASPVAGEAAAEDTRGPDSVLSVLAAATLTLHYGGFRIGGTRLQ